MLLTQTLREKILLRQGIVGAAVGSGLTAKAAEAGGADLLMVLTAGFFRMQGLSSMAALLPYANANQLAWQMASEQVMTRVESVPTFLGVCAQDEETVWPEFFARIKSHGLAGITNFPTVGFIDGNFRGELEEHGLGFQREVKLLEQARAAGLMTIGFCFTSDEAIALARISVDILCLNLGFAEWRATEPAEHQARLDEAILFINRTIAAIKEINPHPYVVVFGGPVLYPQDTALVYQRTEVMGYIGGSTVERFATEPVITQTVAEFKEMARPRKAAHRLGAMIGRSDAMQHCFETIRQVADSNASVLIVAESGAGKELAAREIYRLSPRFTKPLVCWNCGAIPEGLAMSELFGHERGSFTGASRTHVGKFESAHRGTLFMDEVADLPLSVQASLLRVIQEREIIRVGGEQAIKVDVRLIAATNKNFQELIPAKQFRLDLYYRLSTVIIRIPPLRERPDDIPLLVHELAQEFSQIYGCPVPRIPDSVMQTFVAHTWQGNIRELRNVIERGFILGKGKSFSATWLDQMFCFDEMIFAPKETLDLSGSKRARLAEVLARNGGNKIAAARELGVARRTIYNWLGEEN
ncbi:MAG: phosphoenolpyruvate hydrolase family protein [Verrucomicrobia bacterium]|nr:phosphoenolpyruvate hydrolase family protein [Verrucomicrobiota bacterium]